MSYQENILQAVDMVVSQRLNEMSFDKTIVCKVEDDTNASKGEYTVSYQAMTMIAYAANPEEEYNKGQQVYVTVPQGDFNLRKIIIGYVSPSEIPTYLYTNPMKYLVSNEDDIIGLEPNTLYNINLRDYSQESEDLPTIKYLCFSGDFKTDGEPDNPIQTYGINLNFTGVLKETGEEIETSFTFDSSNFQGNPYQFNGYFRQEQLFDIEKYSAIKNLSYELYNNNKEGFAVELFNSCVVTGYAAVEMPEDAKTGKIVLYEKNAIQKYPVIGEEETDDTKLGLNIKSRFYQDNQVTTVSDEALEKYPYYEYKWFIYSKGSEDVGNGKHWAQIVDIKTNEIKDYKGLETSGNASYYIQYKKEFKQNDDGSWDGIKQITIPNQEEKILQIVNQVFKIDKIVTKENDNYIKNLNNPQDRRGSSDYKTAAENYNKAIEDINENTELSEENKKTELNKALKTYNETLANIVAEEKIATSNILAIRRSDQYNIEEALKGSGITLTASGDGSYFVYNGTTNQIDPELKRNKTFRITANLTGAAKWRAGETIRWMIPKNGTMIVAPKTEDYEEDALTEAGNWYIITQVTEENVAPILDFDIKDIYDPAASMNVIRCEIGEKDSENYITDGILLTFGVKGSQGTEYTVSISFEEQDFITPGGSLKLKGHFYDPAGKEIENVNYSWNISQKPYTNPLLSLANENNEIEYITISLEVNTELTEEDRKKYFIKNGNEYINTQDTKVQEGVQYYQKASIYNGTSITVNCLEDITNINQYYGIVSLSLDYEDRKLYGNIKFKTFKAIPIWTGNTETIPSFTGPTNIVYNFQGNSRNFLNSQYSINNKFDNIELIGNQNTGFELSNNKELIAPELISTDPPKITVKLSAAADEIWYQPLAIYRNEYTSAILNSWDGGMEIDTEGNKILTKMIGAGVKDDQNRFSGVFMGAVGKDTTGEKNELFTGLYGYQDGELRFKFTEKGEAYIGTGSDNCIAFNTLQGGDTASADLNRLTIRTKYFTLDTLSNNGKSGIYLSDMAKTINNTEYLFRLGDKLTFDNEGNLFITNDLTVSGDAIVGGKIQAQGDSSKFWNLENGEFKIGDNFHIDTSGNVTIKGNVIADRGNMGGWVIEDKWIYNLYSLDDNTNRRIFLATNIGETYTAFGIREETKAGDIIQPYPFYVTNGGMLVANKAQIRGTLEAGSIIGSSTPITEASEFKNVDVQITTIDIEYTNSSGTIQKNNNVSGILARSYDEINSITVFSFITAYGIFTGSSSGNVSFAEGLIYNSNKCWVARGGWFLHSYMDI